MQTIPKVRNIRIRPEQVARCAGSKKEPEQFSPFGAVADGFLKKQFLPLFEQGQKLPMPIQTQQGFLSSLSILTEAYQLEKIDFENKPYPYNILLAHASAQKQLQKSAKDIELTIVRDKKGGVKLATSHCYSTGTTLYYIPVLPLYRLLQDKKQKKTAELLLSVFAYLYHIAGIPYYRECESYLFYQYECMEEWLMADFENEDADEGNSVISEFSKAVYYGDIMLRKMYNPYHLNCFKERINQFKPESSFQKECLAVAKNAFSILHDYPDYSIFRNISSRADDDNEGIIRAEQYISFIADTDGVLYENIARVVNDEFNECGEIREPKFVQIYDTEHQPCTEGLDFEYRIFPLLNDLCTLLNNMP